MKVANQETLKQENHPRRADGHGSVPGQGRRGQGRSAPSALLVSGWAGVQVVPRSYKKQVDRAHSWASRGNAALSMDAEIAGLLDTFSFWHLAL